MSDLPPSPLKGKMGLTLTFVFRNVRSKGVGQQNAQAKPRMYSPVLRVTNCLGGLYHTRRAVKKKVIGCSICESIGRSTSRKPVELLRARYKVIFAPRLLAL